MSIGGPWQLPTKTFLLSTGLHTTGQRREAVAGYTSTGIVPTVESTTIAMTTPLIEVHICGSVNMAKGVCPFKCQISKRSVPQRHFGGVA
jgi:hypothetical protein